MCRFDLGTREMLASVTDLMSIIQSLYTIDINFSFKSWENSGKLYVPQIFYMEIFLKTLKLLNW